MILRDPDADRLNPLVTPVTVRVRLPFFAVELTDAVNVTVPPPVTVAELRLSATPVIEPPVLRVTVPLKPPMGVTVIV